MGIYSEEYVAVLHEAADLIIDKHKLHSPGENAAARTRCKQLIEGVLSQCLPKEHPRMVTTGRRHRLNQGLFGISAGLQVHLSFKSTKSVRMLVHRSPTDYLSP